MKIHHFSYQDGSRELVERFLELRERIHVDDYYHYPERDSTRSLLDYYAAREDYSFKLFLGEDAVRGDVARLLVGRNRSYDFGFFGFFECPNDLGAFQALMDQAVGVSCDFGQHALYGPIELNALHSWMFLDGSKHDARWVGDPHHRAFYPQLFRRAGWRTAERCTSGVLVPARNAELAARRAELEDTIASLGVKLYRLGEMPEEIFLPDVCALVQQTFTAALHRYVPVEPALIGAEIRPVLRSLHDPSSLLLLYRGDECVAFCLSFDNFIEALCNPRGEKVPPGRSRPPASAFSIRTIGVSPGYWGSGLCAYLLAIQAEHAQTRYRGPFGYRRTSDRNPQTAVMRLDSELTESYVTFQKSWG